MCGAPVLVGLDGGDFKPTNMVSATASATASTGQSMDDIAFRPRDQHAECREVTAAEKSDSYGNGCGFLMVHSSMPLG